MEQLPIVRKRVRLWPILLIIVVVALLVAAAFYMMGDRPVTDVGRMLPAGDVARAVARATLA